MTRNKDFKAVVRSRMRHTGETYTAARTALEAAALRRRVEAQRQQELIVSRWFSAGRLRSIPARRKVRASVLLEVVTRFVTHRTYSEWEVSQLLESIHEDFAYLRRELVSFGYLERTAGAYRVCRTAPNRSERERRELPVWEEIWLPHFVASPSATATATQTEDASCQSH